MATLVTESNQNIQASTRKLWLKTVRSQVFMKHPVLARMMAARRVHFRGGTELIGPIQTAEMDSLIQWYSGTDPLHAESKTLLDVAQFQWKHFQLPVQYGIKEELMNNGGSSANVFDLKQFLVTSAHRGMRIALAKQMYGIDTSTATTLAEAPDTSSDFQDSTKADEQDDKRFQSLLAALVHGDSNNSNFYGGLERSTTSTNSEWQGASVAGSYTDWDAEATMSPDFIYQLQDACMERAGNDYNAGDFLIVMGPKLYRKLKQWVESHGKIPMGKGTLANYGFESFTMDGWEIAKDYNLNGTDITGVERGGNNTDLDASKWVFALCIPTWELRFHTKRPMRFTGFTWQGKVAEGRDEYLGRILATGNLVCWQPGVNIFRAKIT